MERLVDVAAFLFSKNAGPFQITFDIVFADFESYERVRASGIIRKEKLAALYGVPVARVVSVHEYDPGYVLKFTLAREKSSGDFGDRSVFGSQLWAPLIDLEVPDKERADGSAE